MTTLPTAAGMVMAAFQAAFVGSSAVPANWQLTVGQEEVADIDAFTDRCCDGLGVMLVSQADLEVGTSQLNDGTLYTRMTVALGVFRCAPTIGNDLRSPSAAEHLAFSNLVLDDAERMLKAVWAVSQFPWITEEDISDPQWSAFPVEGGCGGGTVTFVMAVIGDCPTP